MNEQIEKLREEALEAVLRAADGEALNRVRRAYLGKDGKLTAMVIEDDKYVLFSSL